MRKLKQIAYVVLLVAAVACGKGKKDEGGGGTPDGADKFFLESVQKSLDEVKQALAKGEDPKYKCAGAGAYAEELTKKKIKAAEATVKELTKLCSYDVPLAALEGATKKAEEARKAKPDEQVLSDCFSADHDLSVEDLKKGGFEGDEKVKAVVARWDAACPPKK
jgi:hypothetical protein